MAGGEGLLNIVIADDELNIIELIQHMLDPQIAHVADIALNGIDAYEAVTCLPVDILITDVRMPGYSGLELIERVKRVRPEIEIIVISGYREFDYLQKILKFGVQEFLLKPIDGVELNAAILRIKDKKSAKSNQERYLAELRSDLRQSQKCLREEYAHKLLYDSASFSDDESIPHNLFRFSGSMFIVLILKADYRMEQNDTAAESMAYVNTLLQRYRATIIQAYQEKCRDIVHITKTNRVYFIFNYDTAPEEEDFGESLHFNKRYIRDILVTESQKYGFLNFTLGIGIPVHALRQLSTSYRSALVAIGNRLDPHTRGVIEGCGGEVSEDIKLDIDLRERLMAALTALDVGKTMRILKVKMQAYCERGEYYKIFCFADAVIAFAKSFVLMQNMLEEAHYAEIFNVEDALDNCFTIQMIEECLHRYFKELVSMVEEVSDKRASKPIRLALDYMKQNFAQPITLQSVAEVVFYTPNYFSNAFKKQTGKTFLEYLTELRMEAAQEMLKSTAKNIAEIAHDVGYSDEKYFSKLFIKSVGIKPNEFRKFYS